MPAFTESDFLSEAWLEDALKLGAKLPKQDGANLKINFEINKTPKDHPAAGKKIRCLAEITDGRFIRLELGKLEDSQVLVRCEYDDILKTAKGELEAEVGYMQGVLKLDGEYNLLLFGLRDFFSSKPWLGFQEKIRSSL